MKSNLIMSIYNNADLFFNTTNVLMWKVGHLVSGSMVYRYIHTQRSRSDFPYAVTF